MAIDQDARSEAVTPNHSPANVKRTSKEEEGPVKGELWAVLRSLILLIGAIGVIGYVIG